jgi:hypothetical protein
MKTKRLNGTMLILVVAFMLILIVFSLATLAMVTVANNRAVTKFEENQSYYTAASALEVFVNGSLSDSVYFAVDGATPRTYYKADGSPLAKMTQGRALELDLYKLSVLSDGVTTKPIGVGDKGTTEIFSATSTTDDDALNFIMNVTDKTVFYDTAGSLPANIDKYGDQFTSNANYKHAEYTVKLPEVTTSQYYGLFADEKTETIGGVDTKYHAKMKVEVIERYYNMSGVEQAAIKEYMEAKLTNSVTDDQAAAVKPIFGAAYNNSNPKASIPQESAIKNAILAGSRHKDYFRIRVTSETELLGVKGVTAREFVISSPMPESGSMAITNFGYSRSGASMSSVGGISSLVATRVSNTNVAGAMFSAGSFYFDTFSSTNNIYAEDSVRIDSASPFMLALDTIGVGNMPNIKPQGYNTVMYAANGFMMSTGGATITGNNSSHMFHLVTDGLIHSTNPRNIYGNVVADVIESPNGMFSIYGDGTTYGSAYVNQLIVYPNTGGGVDNGQINLSADNGIFTKDIIIDNINTLVYDPGAGEFPKTIRMSSDVVISGKLVVNYGAEEWEVTNYVAGTGWAQLKDPITGAVSDVIISGGGSLQPAPNTSKEPQVSYYYDSNGDGTADYTMNDKYQKEVRLPYNFVSDTGSYVNNTLTLDTAQSLYGQYFASSAMWGTGMGIDGDGNGLVDTGAGLGSRANGGDGSLLGFDLDGNGVMDKPIYYGVVTKGSWVPSTGTYDVRATMGAMNNINGDYVGYAKTGNGTYGGVLETTLSAAQRFKQTDGLGDGTSLNIYTNEVTLDNTGGTYMKVASYYGGGSLSGSISYHGTISESGKLPTSAFAPSHEGAYVYLVDTSAGDITLQMPRLSSADNNIALIAMGTGKLNILVPASAATNDNIDDGSAGGSVNMPTYRVGGWQNSNGMVIMTDTNAMISGIRTSGGKLVGPSPTAGVGYSAGSNVTTPSDAGKITMYVDDGVALRFKTGSLINGTVYAPNSFMDLTDGTGAPQSNVRYNQEGAASPVDITISNVIIGNAVCSGYSTGNDAGVLFLPAEAKPEDGKPNFNWNTLRYLSGQNS